MRDQAEIKEEEQLEKQKRRTIAQNKRKQSKRGRTRDREIREDRNKGRSLNLKSNTGESNEIPASPLKASVAEIAETTVRTKQEKKHGDGAREGVDFVNLVVDGRDNVSAINRTKIIRKRAIKKKKKSNGRRKYGPDFKWILVNTARSQEKPGDRIFTDEQCPEKRCVITRDLR